MEEILYLLSGISNLSEEDATECRDNTRLALLSYTSRGRLKVFSPMNYYTQDDVIDEY